MPSMKSLKNSKSLRETNESVLAELMDMLCNNESYNAKIAAAKLILDNQWCFVFDDEDEKEVRLPALESWHLANLESSDSHSN